MTPAETSVETSGAATTWPQTLGRLTGVVALALGFTSAALSVVEHDPAEGDLLRTAAGRPRPGVAPHHPAFEHEVLRAAGPTLLECAAADGHRGEGRIISWSPTGQTEPVKACALGVVITAAAGTTLGVLSVSDDTPQPVDVDRVRLLEELARLAAGLIVLARDSDDPTVLDDETRAVARAVETGQIVPWYQPVIDLASGQVVGFEALARWPGGRVDGRTSAAFIEIAERSDLVIALDHAVVAQALADLSRWRQTHPSLRLSVNLSGRHLEHEDWLDVINAAVARYAVPPGAVNLELTETVGPSDTVSVADARQRGYRVLLDDFGSGWSGLQDLIRTQVDGIKLDMSFARGLGTHADDTVIAAVTQAADQLGLQVTIEGIETREQLDRARALGCHLAQGYLWSPAVPADELEDLLAVLAATRSTDEPEV